MKEVLLDTQASAMMLIYLDGTNNIQSSPNENHAREILELFSTGTHDLAGDPNYTEEDDIPNLALAMTGYRVDDDGNAGYSPFDQYTGTVTLFPGTGYDCAVSGGGLTKIERVVDCIFGSHPNVANHYAKRLLEEYLTPTPSPELIRALAKVIKDKTLGLYTGDKKDSTEYLFATIQTLKNPKVLEGFLKSEFDYIVIDEVHHAEAKSYKRVLDYFKPKFLLGMTATPERTDDADIFKLFDYNIAYEIRLHQALEEDLLCPFHYFAIEDFYIKSEKSLAKDFSKLTNDNRVEHIIAKMNIYKFSGSHRSALMFVSNVSEAKQLATKLTEKGISAKALTSQDSEKYRSDIINQLESNKLEVIVTVDIFNEGIDIPCVNQVILLRPTQSAIVYIQQLGRGLRKYKNKHFVVVLDFIANYDNNFLIPVALSQNNSYDRDELKKFVVSPNSYIVGQSTITFTSIAKEIIYKNIQVTNFSQLKNIKRDYKQLKKELGGIPTLVDFQKYNFISPEVILSAKDTYYDVLKSFKETIAELSKRQYLVLKFISKEFTPAKRLYEILVLENLLVCDKLEVSQLESDLRGKLNDFDIDSFENALKHLSLDIFTVNAARQDYEPLISVSNGKVLFQIADLIKDSKFLESQFRDLPGCLIEMS